MKRSFILFCFSFCIVFAHTTPITIRPGLTLDYEDGKYYIHFEMPDYEELTEVITVYQNASPPLDQFAHTPGDYYFSKIQPFEDDYFDYLSEDGRPELPFYSMNLLLPPNCDNIEVNKIIYDYETIQLTYDYIPSQAGNYSSGDFSYDVSYYGNYNDTWYWADSLIDTVQYRFTKNLIFSIFPCHYEPYSRELTIIKDVTFEISHDGAYVDYAYLGQSLILDRSLYFFYDNYVGYPAPYPQFNDEYLIITADEWADSTALLDFVSHKESLGYHVTLTSLCDIPNGDSPDGIRAYIKTEFNTNHTKYVLLIGSVGDDIENSFRLPFYDGEEENKANPPSDVYYSCLSENDASYQWKDLNPSVFIGRWPLTERGQLRHVVDKTIASDLYLYDGLNNSGTCKIALFSGDDPNNASMENYFYGDCEYIYNNIIQKYSYYSGNIIDGRSSNTSFLSMKNYLELSDNPTWMFIYDGHGSSSYIESPYYWSQLNIGTINTHNLDFQPFGFGFACLLGNIYNSSNFARSWLTSEDGGVTFMAATTKTITGADRYFSRTLFNQLKDKPNMTIGEFVGNGKAKYYNQIKVDNRYYEVKKYVLYGDPSLYLFGIHHYYNQPYNIQEHSLRAVDDKELNDVISIQIYSVTGQLLCAFQNLQPDLQSLPTGTYIIVYMFNNNQKTKKILIK